MPGTLGAVLAGGAGQRLGLGIPKALAMLEGRTLAERAIATLWEVCDSVAMSMSPERPLPPEARHGADAVWDASSGEGPLAGMLAALAGRPWERALVMGVDFPLARPVALRELLARLEGQVAVVPAPGGRLQPLLAVYARQALDRLQRAFASGERSVVAAVSALDPRVLDDAALERFPGGLENWFNVNTRADLGEAARRLSGRAAGDRS